MSITLTCPRCERDGQTSLQSAEGGAVVATCRGCEAVIRVDDGGAAEPVPAPPARPEEERSRASEGMRCPKCETVQPEAEACRSCGLLAGNMAGWRPEDAGVAALAGAWSELEAAWDDDAAHERFKQLVVQRGAFAAAARLYRQRARVGDSRARQEVGRMATMAAAMMSATAGERKTGEAEDEPFRNVLVMLLVLVIVGIIGGAYAFATWSRADDRRQPPPPATRPGL